jgi:HK97 family phage prohead protease
MALALGKIGRGLVQWLRRNALNRSNGMRVVIKEFGVRVRDDAAQGEGGADNRLTFTISTAEVDRAGDVIEADGWDFAAFEKNPVFLWSHDPSDLPLGKVVKLWRDGDAIAAEVEFARAENEKADKVFRLYKGGYLNAVSVGFRPIEMEPIKNENGDITGTRYKRAELLEVSAVSVPANQSALMRMAEFLREKEAADTQESRRGGITVRLRSAIAPHETEVTDMDTEWDAGEMVRRLREDGDRAYYREMFAWAPDDPDLDLSKSAYKFPHHMVDADGNIGAANARACVAGIAALNGARGGADIPESDIEGVYKHLAKHLRDAGIEPPELQKALAAVDNAETRAAGESAGGESEKTEFEKWLDTVDLDRVILEAVERYCAGAGNR